MFIRLGTRLCLVFAVAVPSLIFFNSLFVLFSLGVSEV